VLEGGESGSRSTPGAAISERRLGRGHPPGNGKGGQPVHGLPTLTTRKVKSCPSASRTETYSPTRKAWSPKRKPSSSSSSLLPVFHSKAHVEPPRPPARWTSNPRIDGSPPQKRWAKHSPRCCFQASRSMWPSSVNGA